MNLCRPSLSRRLIPPFKLSIPEIRALKAKNLSPNTRFYTISSCKEPKVLKTRIERKISRVSSIIPFLRSKSSTLIGFRGKEIGYSRNIML